MSVTKANEADWAARDAQVCRLAMSLLKDHIEAEDVVQNAWVGALANNIRHGGQQVGAYMNAAVRNGVRKVWRDGASQSWKDEAGARAGSMPSVLDELARGECSDLLRQAVSELNEPYRSAVSLHYFEDLSSPEIARRLGTNDSTVRGQLKRGLERLRLRLDGSHGRLQWTSGMLVMLKFKTGWVPSATDKLIPLGTPGKGLGSSLAGGAGGFGALTWLAAAIALLTLTLVPLLLSDSNRLGSPSDSGGSLAVVPVQFQFDSDQSRLNSEKLVKSNLDDALSRERISTPDALQVEALRAGLTLSVFGQTPGAHASQIRILELESGQSPFESADLQPDYLVQAAASPVLIPAQGTRSLRHLWVSGAGLRWKRVTIKNPEADESSAQSMILEQGAKLSIHYRGELDLKGYQLVLSRPGSNELLALLNVERFPLELEGLPAGALKLQVLRGVPATLLVNGNDFFSINPDIPPICSQLAQLEALGDNLVELQLLPSAAPIRMLNVSLQLNVAQPIDTPRGWLVVVPTTMQGFAEMPKRIFERLSFDPAAPRGEFQHDLRLPRGRYQVGVAPMLHMQEVDFSDEGQRVSLTLPRAEAVTLELGTSFWGADQRPERLFLSRWIELDHFPLETGADINWKLSTCSVQLVPGTYTARPELAGNVVSNMQPLKFEVQAGQAQRIPLSFKDNGLTRPRLGFTLELRHQGSIIPITNLPTSLDPIGHDGEFLAYADVMHPVLRGPGRYPAFPMGANFSDDAIDYWNFPVLVTKPGAYLLGVIHRPPYLPTQPQVIQINPGEFKTQFIELELN